MAMNRSTSLVLLGLAVFLVLFPLTLDKPGWPAGLKADEPAYFLMALSLAHDFDLRVETADLRRLFNEFPHNPAANVILMTDDGWHTVYFGKPYVYSLLAAPGVRLFGANGMVALNMALLLAMIYLGARYLERFNPAGVALYFSAGFFLLSAGFAYVFWLHPELFNMAAIMASLYLGLTEGVRGKHRRFLGAWLARREVRLAMSAAFLALAVYNKPMLAAVGLPVFFLQVRERRWRVVAAYALGGALALAVQIGGSMALTGHPSAYLGVARAGVKVCSPNEMPIQPLPPPPVTAVSASAEPARGSLADKRRAAWWWIFKVPEVPLRQFVEHSGFFLWGRHVGLFPYFPFTLLSLGLFLAHARRSTERWVLLGSLAVVAVFLLLFIPFNWHGGGGFVGNRYYVNVYPAFLFLVTRIAPSWIPVVGYLLGGLLLGPTIFSPMGRSVPWPTLQAHVRNFPFPHLPLELSVKGIPGYHEASFSGQGFKGRKDVFLPHGSQAWIRGATTAEIWIRSAEPLADFHFDVHSLAPSNEVTLRLGSSEKRLSFSEADSSERVELTASRPTRTFYRRGQPIYNYRLEVRSTTGEVREWSKYYPPTRDCSYFPYNEMTLEPFFVGVELSFLGTTELLERDLYAVRWGRVEAPETVTAGETFTVHTRLHNQSDETWPSSPPTRVNLAYHWLDEDGNEVVRNGLRTFLEGNVEPGSRVAVEQTVEAPQEPGSYILVIDLVYEGVSWFASKNGDQVVRRPIEVVPADTATQVASGN
jgi:hypothetical protein